MKNTKIFGIGFHKTGTTSLASALRRLGYSVTGPDGAHNHNIAEEAHDIVFDLAEQHDAFQDNPWPLFYKELDIKYPGSKFILTIRPTDNWIKSLVKHFGQKTTPMRKWIYGDDYGYPEGNEQIYIDRYEKHNREVQEYFKDRPGDLLVFRITEGDEWEKLCYFLHEPIPEGPFPHENRIADREELALRQYSILYKIGRKLFG